jgi:hypothetical protein
MAVSDEHGMLGTAMLAGQQQRTALPIRIASLLGPLAGLQQGLLGEASHSCCLLISKHSCVSTLPLVFLCCACKRCRVIAQLEVQLSASQLDSHFGATTVTGSPVDGSSTAAVADAADGSCSR